MLQDALDMILGTRTKVRLLRSLIFLDRPVSGREAARLAGVSPIAQQAMEELRLTGVLNRTTTSNGYLYSMNTSNVLAQSLLDLFTAERTRYSDIITCIRKVLGSIDTVLSASFFGSAARGEESPGSDLDVLIVVKRSASKEEIQESLAALESDLATNYGITLSTVILTLGEISEQAVDRTSFIAGILEDTNTIYGEILGELIVGHKV
jgi:predicted nucleotidyltransferase